MDILLILIIVCVVIRCMMYGIWTFRKNITGGIFISLLSLGTLAFSVYLMLRS